MEFSDLLKAALGVLTGAVGTYLGLYWKVRQDLVAKYDQEIRAERSKHYASLWQITEPLAKYTPPGPVTYSVLHSLAKRLRQWYFKEGGMFMTDQARDSYFTLQDAIVAAQPTTTAVNPDSPVPKEAEQAIRERSSQLRTILASDIGSRKGPLLNDSGGA